MLMNGLQQQMGLQGKLTSNSSTSPPGLGPDLVREKYGFAINSEINYHECEHINSATFTFSITSSLKL